MANIKVLLAGRIAEELIFGEDEVTTGASDDIKKSSNMIMDYVNKFGMDKEFGLFNLQSVQGELDESLIKKCRNELNYIYEETKELLKDNIDVLENIAKELLDKESIDGNDIERICA